VQTRTKEIIDGSCEFVRHRRNVISPGTYRPRLALSHSGGSHQAPDIAPPSKYNMARILSPTWRQMIQPCCPRNRPTGAEHPPPSRYTVVRMGRRTVTITRTLGFHNPDSRTQRNAVIERDASRKNKKAPLESIARARFERPSTIRIIVPPGTWCRCEQSAMEPTGEVFLCVCVCVGTSFED
jgi:hypothetical protein